jgi:hypothetical protein
MTKATQKNTTQAQGLGKRRLLSAAAPVSGADPILALIDQHQAAWNAHEKAVNVCSRRLGDPTPAEAATIEAVSDAEIEAWQELLCTAPATLAGQEGMAGSRAQPGPGRPGPR